MLSQKHLRRGKRVRERRFITRSTFSARAEAQRRLPHMLSLLPRAVNVGIGLITFLRLILDPSLDSPAAPPNGAARQLVQSRADLTTSILLLLLLLLAPSLPYLTAHHRAPSKSKSIERGLKTINRPRLASPASFTDVHPAPPPRLRALAQCPSHLGVPPPRLALQSGRES